MTAACASPLTLRALGVELRWRSIGEAPSCFFRETAPALRYGRPAVSKSARYASSSIHRPREHWTSGTLGTSRRERTGERTAWWSQATASSRTHPWRPRTLETSTASHWNPARLFSSTSTCLRADEKPHDATSGRPPPSSASPKPRGSIRAAAATVHENIYTIPNLLTFTRLLAGPGLAYLIVHDASHLAAFGLFVYAGVTDALDGYLARRWKQTSVVGSVLDPMADKTLMTAATLALAAQARLPWPLAVVILGRDVLLALAAIYYRWISLPPPKTMARYWDFSLPSAEVRPTGISKVNTALQLVLIGATVAMPLVPESIVTAWRLGDGLVGAQWVVGLTTIWSGLSYVGSTDAVRILGREKEKGR